MSVLAERQVVVLAGGLGTRLSALAGDLPKALRPIGGRPFLEVMLDPLRRQGLRRFHFCLGHGGEQIAGHLERLDSALEITYSIEPAACGTAGALLHSEQRLDEVFLLAMGDTLLEFGCGQLFDALAASAEGVLVVSSADTGVTPNVALAGDVVVRYDKAGVPGGFTDTGLAVLRRRALRALGAGPPPLDLTALFRPLIERRGLRAVITEQGFHDIGTPERYRRLDRAVPRGLARC